MDEHLLRFQKRKLIVADCETESLNLHYSRPWEISWLVVENNQIVKECQRYLLYNDLNISEGAAKATRFNKQYYLSKAIDPLTVYNEFKEYLYNPEYLVVGMNWLNFDLLRANPAK